MIGNLAARIRVHVVVGVTGPNPKDAVTLVDVPLVVLSWLVVPPSSRRRSVSLGSSLVKDQIEADRLPKDMMLTRLVVL